VVTKILDPEFWKRTSPWGSMNTYEELAVLEQGEDGAIVSIRGQGGPCVLLGPDYLGHLAGLLGRSSEDGVCELRATARYEPMAALCSEMRTLLKRTMKRATSLTEVLLLRGPSLRFRRNWMRWLGSYLASATDRSSSEPWLERSLHPDLRSACVHPIAQPLHAPRRSEVPP
jgi:hypothetical protein